MTDGAASASQPTIRMQSPEERIEPTYANSVYITSSDRDFVLSFARVTPAINQPGAPPSEIRITFPAQIIMNEKTVRELRNALDTQIAQFEERQRIISEQEGQGDA